MMDHDHDMPVPHAADMSSGFGQPTGDVASDTAKKELHARADGQQAVHQVSPREAMRMFLQDMSTNKGVSRDIRDSAKLLRRAPSDPTVELRKQQLFDRAVKSGSLKNAVSPPLLHFYEANLHHQQDLPDDLKQRANAGTLQTKHEDLVASAHTHEEQRVAVPEVVHAPAGGEVKKAAVQKHKLEEYAGAIIAPTFLG